MPSPCPHLHLHSTHSPSFFSKHPCDLSFSWSFMIREIFLYLSEMWFSQLFSQVWQLWLTPFLITSVRDKKSMYRGRCRLAPRQTNEAMFFCFFFSKCRWCYRSKVGNTPTITNPPKKMIYIYVFSRNQWNCLRPFNNWGWYTIWGQKIALRKRTGIASFNFPALHYVASCFIIRAVGMEWEEKTRGKQKLWRDG